MKKKNIVSTSFSYASLRGETRLGASISSHSPRSAISFAQVASAARFCHPNREGFRGRCLAGERICHTGRKGLLELLGLVGILEDQSVQVLLAADLELDVLGLLVLLDARGCSKKNVC